MKYIIIILSCICVLLGIYIYQHQDIEVDVIEVDSEQYGGVRDDDDVNASASDTMRVQSLRVYDGIKTNNLEVSTVRIWEGNNVPLTPDTYYVSYITKNYLNVYESNGFIHIQGFIYITTARSISSNSVYHVGTFNGDLANRKPRTDSYFTGHIITGTSLTAVQTPISGYVDSSGELYCSCTSATLSTGSQYTIVFSTEYRYANAQ